MTAKMKKKEKPRARSAGKGELFVVTEERDGVGAVVFIMEEEEDGVGDRTKEEWKDEEGVAC